MIVVIRKIIDIIKGIDYFNLYFDFILMMNRKVQ